MEEEEKRQLIKNFHNGKDIILGGYEFSHFNIYCKENGIIDAEEVVAKVKPDSLIYIDKYAWDNSRIMSINAVYLNPDDKKDGKVVPFFYINKETGETKVKGQNTSERIDKSKLLEIIKDFD